MSSLENKVFRVYEEPDGRFTQKTEIVPIPEPSEGEVLIRVHFSSLNYKDALSATGNKGVTKHYPHTPGTDAAGTVVKSCDTTFREGDRVIVTGYDLGMNTNGGWAGYICVPSGWVVPLPEKLSLKESMMLGTAGFTAALALYKLELNGLKPSNGPVLVSGATGGVGCLSVLLLKQTGYDVVAVTGKKEASRFLKSIGADEILSTDALKNNFKKPLLQQKWAAVIETTGGKLLEFAMKCCMMHGYVVACGNAESDKFSMTVYPFILRGISLLGVTASNTPMKLRRNIWQRVSGTWKPAEIEKVITECNLKELPQHIERMLNRKMMGRVIVNCNNPGQ